MQKKYSASVRSIYKDRDQLIEVLKRCAANAAKAKGAIKKVILFGSIARGNYALFSDADILIILERSRYSRFFDRIPEYIDFFLDADIPVDLFPYTVKEINRMKHYNRLIKTALKDGVILLNKGGNKK